MEERKLSRLLVLGAGNFGTCLAQHLSGLGHDVTIWSRSESVAQSIQNEHRNSRYMPEIDLNTNLQATTSLDPDFVASFDGYVLAIPTQALRKFCEKMPQPSADRLIISAAKGIEQGSLKLPSTIIADVWGDAVAYGLVSLSGPSFAIEVAQNQPTGVAVASRLAERAAAAQEVFHSPFFRTYTSEDPVGLEVAGALKKRLCYRLGRMRRARVSVQLQRDVDHAGVSGDDASGYRLGCKPTDLYWPWGRGVTFFLPAPSGKKSATTGLA